MAWNGSGTFVRLFNWVDDRDGGIKILAARMDSEMDGMATGITACLAKNGENSPTTNLPMGGNKHTGVAVATARDEYLSAGQAQDGALISFADTGAADAYVITPSPAITAYSTYQKFIFAATNASTGASTLNVNGLGVKTIKKNHDQDIEAGDIESGGLYVVQYDGTNFQLLSPSSLLPLTQGEHSPWIPAQSLKSATTNGAGTGSSETTTNAVMLETKDFDPATEEYVQFTVGFPKSWDEGTITMQFKWEHPATATNFGTAWFVQALTVGDGDALDAAWGTAVGVTDTGGTTEYAYITSYTAAVTPAGTPGSEELTFFRVFRKVSDAGDDLAVDAKLLGLRFKYTVNAGNDA